MVAQAETREISVRNTTRVVENLEQQQLLRGVLCDYGQGMGPDPDREKSNYRPEITPVLTDSAGRLLEDEMLVSKRSSPYYAVRDEVMQGSAVLVDRAWLAEKLGFGPQVTCV
jgi:hypothetical protein